MDDIAQQYELKIQALREGFKEKIASVYDMYEDKVANLRVELTNVSNRAQGLQEEVNRLLGELEAEREDRKNVALEKEDAGE